MDFKIFPVLFVVFYQFLQEPIFLSNVEPSEQPSSNIDKQDFPDSDICQTEGCTMAASQLSSFMDKTVDPCTDFYQYACGNFSANAVIPDHRTSVSLGFSVIQDKINERLQRLFEGENFASEPKIFQQVRNFYHSCMDKETIENNSVNELKEILTNAGGWPVLEGQNWNGGDFKWNELASRLSQEGLDSKPMILIGILPDEKDSLRNKIWIDEPWLGLSREYLIKGLNDKDVQAYYNYMVKTAVFLGAQEDVAEQEMKEALKFELKLAELSLPREERRNETALYNPMTLAEVQNLYPEIPMNNFISGVLGSNDAILEENEVVNVAVPKYITDFRNLITTVPARVQANYMVWRSIMNKMGYLNDSALKIKLAYEKNLWGITQEAPRWEKCVGSTRSSIVGQAVGSMYVREFFKINSKNVTYQIVDNVLEEFKIMLNESNWIDSKTKLEAIKKVDAITSHIAYQYEILDDSLMNEFYKHIDLKKESYLKNKIQLNQFHLKNNLENLRKPIDPMSWKTRMQAYMVNAEYNPHENSINIPAGIIDGVWFDTDRPQYMNYGALGLVIGHELTHGFDDMGSQWDAKGNLVDWWEPESKKKYLEKTQCIIEQYGNYTVEVDGETLKLNGKNTQGENIADNGGIKEAFRAYNRLVEKDGQELILPGLGLSQRQVFWLSAASVWCNVMRPATLKSRVLTNSHPPGKFRVNGPFANMPEFAEDWNCPAGSKMNPEEKCSVW